MKKIITKYKPFLMGVFVWGILAHGMGMFRKISFLDELFYTFDVGVTYTSGRWMLGIVASLVENVFGGHYSLPIFNSIITFLMIAVSGCLLINLFEIRRNISMIAISGIMVMFPTISSLFCGYMYTAPYYFLAVAMCVGGTYLICKYGHLWYGFFGGIILVACSVGIYQAYIPIALSIMVMYMLKTIKEKEKVNWAEYFKQAAKYIMACIIILIIYLIVNKFSLWVQNLQMNGYKDADTFNMTDLSGYYWRIRLAYSEFFMPATNPDFIKYNMYRGSLGIIYKIMIGFDVVLCVYWLFGQKSGIAKKIQCGILLFLFPLAVNFIFVMINRWYVYSLMVYAQVLVFFFTIWLTENVLIAEKSAINKYKNYIGLGIVFAACILYWRYDNTCYLKAEFIQAQMDSWCTTLVTQIKSIDNYEESMPVVFINDSNKSDENWPHIEELDWINIEPFSWEAVVNDNTWIEYLKYRCGYAPDVLQSESYEEKDEVIGMPSYPDSGSVQIIDDVIVVKF